MAKLPAKTEKQQVSKRQNKSKAKKPARTEQENALLASTVERDGQRLQAPKVRWEGNGINRDHDDPAVFWALMTTCFGTDNHALINEQLRSVVNAAPKGDDGKADIAAVNASLGILYGIQPKDELEAMLAIQMLATHRASMTCLYRASLPEQPFQAKDMNLRYATKLTRIYVEQMEALNKKRGKGQQKMTVEHIHVHDGGQAIVGNVKGGGGH